MASSKLYSATPVYFRSVDHAFADRVHDPARYRQEAVRLRRDAEMQVNTTIAERLLAVARHFDELAVTVQKMRARQARP